MLFWYNNSIILHIFIEYHIHTGMAGAHAARQDASAREGVLPPAAQARGRQLHIRARSRIRRSDAHRPWHRPSPPPADALQEARLRGSSAKVLTWSKCILKVLMPYLPFDERLSPVVACDASWCIAGGRKDEKLGKGKAKNQISQKCA